MSAKRIRVVAAVVRRDATYLVCQRPLHKQHGGLWEFPGGKCEPGETDEAATRRELYEELGVRVTAVGGPLMTVHDPGSVYEIVFVPTEIEGDPHPHEHAALAWYSVELLQSLALAPSDAAFVQSLA